MTKTMLITLHDLDSVDKGRAMMCGFDDGTSGLLRLFGTPRDPESLAEARALDEDLPILDIGGEDMRAILHGDTVLTYGSTGILLVRMMTADELLAAHAKACAGFDIPTSLTQEKAEELTRTL